MPRHELKSHTSTAGLQADVRPVCDGGGPGASRKNGKQSLKLPEATATEIADQIRRWLVGTLDVSDHVLPESAIQPGLPSQSADDATSPETT